MTIFVSIAAYRDPELVPTIRDCLANARDPDALRFGICWQHGPEEARLPFADDSRFRILDVDYRESRGACWARAEVMKLYAGEDYFLQLDSHHRFAPDWDARALDQLARTGSEKAVLTAYAPAFTPGDERPRESTPTQMDFDRFTREGIVLFRPSTFDPARTGGRPLRARFLSGHFLFAKGTFVEEVPYDPELYFTGEEITLAIRAFTHGWDFFHPSEVIVWHEYTREYRPHKHWSDHSADAVAVPWHVRDEASKARVKRFLASPHIGPFGCGTVRTFAEYEAFAGLSFARQRAQDYTLRRGEPPNPPAPPGWSSRVARYEVPIVLDRSHIDEASARAPFWFVGFHDAHDEEIFRRDADAAEIARVLAQPGPQLTLDVRAFESGREPASWLVWPYSPTEGWLDRIRGDIVLRPPEPVTYVTALLDIDRHTLDPSQARAFEAHYLPRFAEVLAIDAPMVVHVDASLEPFVWAHRDRENTQIVRLDKRALEAAPFFAKVQAIRAREAWSGQADWLRESPQARLPHYNPLVLSKLLFLRRAARENRFGTERFFFVDAGLSSTVRGELLHEPSLSSRLAAATRDLLFLAFPYDGPEIHGFPRRELEALAGGPVELVPRGGFFGGTADAVLGLAALYESLLHATLDAGLMGTEESLFAVLAARHPELVRPFVVGRDGLVFPFFEALREGREAAMRAQAPRGARVDDTPLARELLEAATRGETRFFGLRMQQSPLATRALNVLLRTIEAEGRPIRRIVELGTGQGGLTVLLGLYALDVGAELVTYDLREDPAALPLLERLGVRRRVADLRHEFVRDEVTRTIGDEGLSLVICDAGRSRADLALAIDAMKRGDLVLVHDYAASHEVFEKRLNGRLWSWCEATDADVLAAAGDQVLEELLPEVLHEAAWTCRRKISDAVRRAPKKNLPERRAALYVLTYNLPEQLRLWIESVERADPAMLAETEKYLFDNSTDPATRDAYDALAARHGFHVLRADNAGITGGRIACAHHFETETACDAMLYFEDDMLLHGEDGTCKSGFRTRVPDLFARAMTIVENEPGLDLLKLSFSELYGDHHLNWAYVNLEDARKQALFPSGGATRIDAIKSASELAYALGEVHYSNWPMIVTRRGSATLFPRGEAIPRHEQGLMIRALELGRAGQLRAGVLLASPIRHHRAFHYGEGERKEG